MTDRTYYEFDKRPKDESSASLPLRLCKWCHTSFAPTRQKQQACDRWCNTRHGMRILRARQHKSVPTPTSVTPPQITVHRDGSVIIWTTEEDKDDPLIGIPLT